MSVTDVTPLPGAGSSEGFPRRAQRRQWRDGLAAQYFHAGGLGDGIGMPWYFESKQWHKAGLDQEFKKWWWNSVLVAYAHWACVSLLNFCDNPMGIFFYLRVKIWSTEKLRTLFRVQSWEWPSWELDPCGAFCSTASHLSGSRDPLWSQVRHRSWACALGPMTHLPGASPAK